MKLEIDLGDDHRENLSALQRAYVGLEQLVYDSKASQEDIYAVLHILNRCLDSATKRVPATPKLAVLGKVA